MASLEAGVSITQSLTGAVIPGAIAVNDDPVKHDDIVDALNAGKLILSRRGDGAIVIEKDQNSLHTFTPTKSYIFSKNRPMRVLDQIGNDVKTLFNTSYLGKVNNGEDGRNIYKNDLVSYFKTLEGMGAIQNFWECLNKAMSGVLQCPGFTLYLVSSLYFVQRIEIIITVVAFKGGEVDT